MKAKIILSRRITMRVAFLLGDFFSRKTILGNYHNGDCFCSWARAMQKWAGEFGAAGGFDMLLPYSDSELCRNLSELFGNSANLFAYDADGSASLVAAYACKNECDEGFILADAANFFGADPKLFAAFAKKRHGFGISCILRTEGDFCNRVIMRAKDSWNGAELAGCRRLSSDEADAWDIGPWASLGKDAVKALRKFEQGMLKGDFFSSAAAELSCRVQTDALPLGGPIICWSKGGAEFQRAENWLDAESKPCVFLDKDDTLIRDPGYVHGPDIDVIQETFMLISELKSRGWLSVIVTNQAGVAKGKFDELGMRENIDAVSSYYAERGIPFDDVRKCCYHIDGKVEQYKKNSQCRKPYPGMLLEAASVLKIDFLSSVMYGDREDTDGIYLPYLKSACIADKKIFRDRNFEFCADEILQKS